MLLRGVGTVLEVEPLELELVSMVLLLGLERELLLGTLVEL